MPQFKNSTTGTGTRARTAVAAVAATLLVGGTATEASAGTRHHHHHYRHHHHHAGTGLEGGSSTAWRDTAATSSAGGHSFSGIASFYGNESGSKTASGQRFNQNAMTCAHRSLPFGTKLRVSHGGRSVVVTVNDRGPFIRGRVLDLSTAAARAIGIDGIGHVTAEVIG
jgi:rare lipoprotein A